MADRKMLDLGRNHILYGDCLEMLERVPDESVDLIYLDPPFNSNANYNMLFGSETDEDTAQIKAFADTWYWQAEHNDVYLRLLQRNGAVGRVIEAMFIMLGKCGMLAYVLFMAERLIELQRVLKPTGSLYLHCDPTASHYLKLVLDAVFGTKMFRNEIVWSYRTGGSSTRHFSKKHDVILLFSKSDEYNFNSLKERAYTKAKSRKAGLVNYGAGTAEFFEDDKGVYNLVNMRDVWDIPYINSQSAERLGYPTQKPLALLDRIIEASSNKGDVVLDPFCGCGTAVDAAQALGRHWIGMDISVLAINVIRARLEDVHGDDVMRDVEVTGILNSIEAAHMLFTKHPDGPFEFERWAVGLIRARPNKKQRGDGGSDGLLRFFAKEKGRIQRGLVSVKGGKTLNPAMVRDLNGAVNTMPAAMGVLILMEQPTKGMVDEAAKAGMWMDEFTQRSFPKLQIITIAELLDGRQPDMPTPLKPYTKAAYTHDAKKQGDWL